MLIELAIGDAYGAGFEYANEMVASYNNLSTYIQHPRHKEIFPGMYTDDTQMSLAIAELIVSGVDWTPLNIATKFVECFKRDKRTGYSGHFYQFLQTVQSGAEFLEKIVPESDKSGAAMRSVPIGIYATPEIVLEKARIQAMLTHNTVDGIQAAQAVALASHYFLYQLGEKRDLGNFLEEHVPSPHRWSKFYQGKVKSKGWMSARAAFTAIMRNDNMADLLMDCINFTGDVDTVATIALGCAAHCPEIEQNLPKHFYERLENGFYGYDYLKKLDEQLLSRI